MRLKIIISILLWTAIEITAAELPSKGIEPPAVVKAGTRPHNPPIGNGLAVITIFGVLYAIKKRKKDLD